MDCSALITSSAKTRWSVRVVVYTIAFAFCTTAASSQEAEELDDAATRMQYAYYTGDARALESVLAEIESLDTDERLAGFKAYHLAYGHWRLAQLLAEAAAAGSASNDRSLAARAVQKCAKHARDAVDADARNADAYAIQAICPVLQYAQPSASRSGRREASGSCRSSALRTANALGPENPRVQLVSRLCAKEPDAPEDLRKVVEAFESASPRASRTPDWGHAEALTLLGQSYLTKGDALAARDALERALVIAPDYREAQELLQTAAARPR